MFFGDIVEDKDNAAILKSFVAAYRRFLFHILGIQMDPRAANWKHIGSNLSEILDDDAEMELSAEFLHVWNKIPLLEDDELKRHGLSGSQLIFKIKSLKALEKKVAGKNSDYSLSEIGIQKIGSVSTKIADSVLEICGAGTAIKEIGGVVSEMIGEGFEKLSK